MIKKSLVSDLSGPSAQGFVLSRVNAGDELGWAFVTDGSSEILLVTALGMLIRFSEQEVRPMGLVAAGVNGIKLETKDRVAAAERLSGEGEILFVSSEGLGWRIEKDGVPLQGRYGQGVLACKLTGSNRLVGAIFGKRTQTALVHFQQAAARLTRLDEVPLGKRLMKGQDLAPVKANDAVLNLTAISDGLVLWESEIKSTRKPRRTAEKNSTPTEKTAPAKKKAPAPPDSKKSTSTAKAKTTAKPKPADRSKPAATPKTPAVKPADKPTPVSKTDTTTSKPASKKQKPASAAGDAKKPKPAPTSRRKP